MRILVLGPMMSNGGPDNANKQIVSHWPASDDVVVLSSQSKGSRIIEALYKGMNCDVILSLGVGIDDRVPCRVLSAFGKPYVHFCHGYMPYENQINHLGLSERKMQAIVGHLERATYLVTNSNVQKRFIAAQLPSVAEKIKGFPLGVDAFEPRNHTLHAGTAVIAVSGGSRPVKGNDTVAKAVTLLKSEGMDCVLRVYGHRYAKNSSFDDACHETNAQLMGQVTHEEFDRDLQTTDLFVMNSRYEPFGLSAIDALRNGASVLLSQNCGVKEILNLEPNDIIEDCDDAGEIAQKMAYLLERPNAWRLYRSLDFSSINWNCVVSRIRTICVKAVTHD